VCKPFSIILALSLVLSAACVLAAGLQENQNPPATNTAVPATAVNQANPVKPTAESLATGKKYYGYDCAMCHGANGDGKGDVAVDEKMNVGDFRESLAGKTDGELHYIIKNGKGQMPPEGDRLKGNELWSLVNYVRSLAKK